MILDKLNSFNSVSEINSALNAYSGRKIFSDVIAKRLFNTKVQINKFKSLNQIATIPGIGRKKFNALVSILTDCS